MSREWKCLYRDKKTNMFFKKAIGSGYNHYVRDKDEATPLTESEAEFLGLTNLKKYNESDLKDDILKEMKRK